MRRAGQETPSRSKIGFQTAFDRPSGGFYFEFMAWIFSSRPKQGCLACKPANMVDNASKVEQLDLVSALNAHKEQPGTSALVPAAPGKPVHGDEALVPIADTSRSVGRSRAEAMTENAYSIWIRE